jgi:hypothetical protein
MGMLGEKITRAMSNGTNIISVPEFGKRISRAEAMALCQKIMEDAERERLAYWREYLLEGLDEL